MLNRDVFAVDPTGRRLPNDGVTALDVPSTPEEWSVLRYELEQFVARGEYGEGLRRILNSFLANVDKGTQPACWVSGFYGSGKSHFIRVLSYLWTNPKIDGVAARDLVRVPDDVATLLKEIDSFAVRDKTVTFSAAGVMRRNQGSSVAQPLMEILLGAAGLPTQIGPARFVLWLHEQGAWDRFVEALVAKGKTVEEVSRNLFVSPPVRSAILEALPGWEPDAKAVGEALRANFQFKQVTDDIAIDTIRQVLEAQARESKYGDSASFPLTLVVLDELQQYIGDDVQLLLETQDLIERLTRQFQGRLLVVAAGQSALTANDVLARFQDRFTVHVQLQSRDVETVVREVVLRKDPQRVPELDSVLQALSGEYSKHLAGSKLAFTPADKKDLIVDYPLLPTRRRFLETALRAVDRGAAGMLRSQLRVTLGAVDEVAGEPLGTVVPGDVIFREKREDMLNHGVMTHDLADRIAAVQDGSAAGELRARAVELVFLIGHLAEEDGVDATIDTLADLLVTDLNAGSAELRAELPALLQVLEGHLLVVDEGVYRLQSPTDAEWDRAFREKRAALMSSTGEQVQVREDAIRRRLETEKAAVKVVQGATNTPRKFELVVGETPLAENDTDLHVWIRSGWDTSENNVKQLSSERGMDDSLVLVYLPKMHDQELKTAVADARAARHVVQTQPAPTTEDGLKARDAMHSLATRAEVRIESYVQSIMSNAVVLLCGGEVVSSGGSLAGNLREALQKAAVRKFPRFQQADNAGWAQVYRKAREGNPGAMTSVGHAGEASTHPVPKEVKTFVRGGATGGSAIHKHFAAAPFGWPRDAVNGALAVLVLGEELSARDGATVVPATKLQENQLGKYEYKVETIVVSLPQRQKLKKLAITLGLPYDPRVDVNHCLHTLRDEAAKAGGTAPLPPAPDVPELEVLLGKFAAEQDVAVADKVDDLLGGLATWRTIAGRIPLRLDEWSEAQTLMKHAAGLPGTDEHRATLQAIEDQRSLLSDPDPVPPVLASLRSALRTAVQELHERIAAARESAIAQVADVPQWASMSADEQKSFLASTGLDSVEAADISTDSQLLATLDRQSLAARADAVPALAGKAQAAVKALLIRFAPQAQYLKAPAAVITTAAEADDYLARLRSAISEHLAAGHPVNLS